MWCEDIQSWEDGRHSSSTWFTVNGHLESDQRTFDIRGVRHIYVTRAMLKLAT